MKFYLFTSGYITAAMMAVFMTELQAAYPGAYYEVPDASNGSPVGDEDGFAIYGQQADWTQMLVKLAETGKPIFTKWL